MSEECSSFFLRPWARRWINRWSLWRMGSTVTLPAAGLMLLDRYQIMLLGNRGTCVWTTCPRLLPESGTVEIRTRDLWSRKWKWWQTSHNLTRVLISSSSSDLLSRVHSRRTQLTWNGLHQVDPVTRRVIHRVKWRHITYGDMVTIRSPFCGYNTV